MKKEKEKRAKKRKSPAEKPISLRPLGVQEALSNLLRVKPTGRSSRAGRTTGGDE